jgi:hypothetical protein
VVKRRFGMRKGQKQDRGATPKIIRPSGKSFAATIKADEAYTLDQFVQMTGEGPSAIRTAEANGLNTSFSGNRKWILGKEWIAYLEKRARQKSPKQTKQK